MNARDGYCGAYTSARIREQVRTRTVKEDEDPRAIRAEHSERNPPN